MANINLFSSINLLDAIPLIAMIVVEGVKSRVAVGAIISSSLPKVIPESRGIQIRFTSCSYSLFLSGVSSHGSSERKGECTAHCSKQQKLACFLVFNWYHY
jgi:hypothetical protein